MPLFGSDKPQIGSTSLRECHIGTMKHSSTYQIDHDDAIAEVGPRFWQLRGSKPYTQAHDH